MAHRLFGNRQSADNRLLKALVKAPPSMPRSVPAQLACCSSGAIIFSICSSFRNVKRSKHIYIQAVLN